MDVDNRQLLDLLAAGPLDGATLAARLGVAAGVLEPALERLRAAGAVQRAAGRWQLHGVLDRHDLPALHAALAPASRRALAALELAWQVDSTNSELLRRPAPGHGVHALLAEAQSAGRGRRGRTWASPLSRHLYLSLCWRAEAGLAGLAGLSVAVGVVVAEVLRGHGLAAGLKWPNDLLLGEAKLAGILVETAGPAAGPLQVVLGIGLNVHGRGWQAEGIGQPWTALDAHLDPVPSRDRLATDLLDALLPALALHRRQGLAAFLPRYAALDLLADRPIWIDDGAGRQPAVALGLAADGGLRVRDARGERRLHAGMVSVRKQ